MQFIQINAVGKSWANPDLEFVHKFVKIDDLQILNRLCSAVD